jgi:tripartite-type tricarboxylate transporter receptor subunit TctC
MDFAKTDVDRKALEMLFSPQISAWPLIAPPEVPKERIAILRQAFDATMKDPAFLADAEKMQIEIDPVSGETMQNVVARIASFDRSVVDRALELTQR